MTRRSFRFLTGWGEQMGEVIYQYDGSLEGFFCCVYECYAYKETPASFCCEDDPLSLYEVRTVITQSERSRRVQLGISGRSKKALALVRRGFLTCMEDKELHLLALIRKLIAEGPGFLRDLSDPTCYPVYRAIRHMNGELEKLRGYFGGRYGNERFFIYDRTHRELLFYADGKSRIAAVEGFQPTLPGGEELQFRALWKRFFETVAIRERENPRCQNTFLPKRYRGTMTEFLPLEYERERYDGGTPLPESGT